jgi:cytochrome P450
MVPEPDLNAPAVHGNPFEAYRQLRESDPVHWSESFQGWCLYRHADVQTALGHPAFSSKRLDTFRRLTPPDRAAQVAEAFETLERWILFQDGEAHRRQRRLFGHGFAPGAIRLMLPRIEAVADELLRGLAGRPAFDAAAEFAIPFPVTVIADLFAVEPGDRMRVQHWSDDIASFLTSIPIPAAACDRIGPTLRDLTSTMAAVVASRRGHSRGEFIDELIRAGEDGTVLETADLMANFSVLLLAGNETTRNLIGNGIHLLLQHPDVLEQLRADEGLWDRAVLEILRYRSPIQMISRQVVEEVELGGKRMKPGDQVFCMLGAANHDPAVFPDPERFDLRRANASDHLAFGAGPHFCIGYALALAEGRIALRRLFETFPGLRADPARPAEFLPITRLMGFTHLPVVSGG